MSRARVSVVVAMMLLSGCSFHPRPQQPLSNQAVSFNLTVEEAQNEMLLLNVVRASERMPMYLTAVSSLNGNLQRTYAASLGGSYTEVSGDSSSTQTSSGGTLPTSLLMITDGMTRSITRGLVPSLGGSVSQNPNFTVAVLDNEKFTRGFLSPIHQTTFAHLWNQGWPPELLLYLLVQRVEVGSTRYENYPPDKQELERFSAWVQEFVARQPRIERTVEPRDIGPPLEAKNLDDVGDLIAASQDGLRLKPVGKQWQLERLTSDLRLAPTIPSVGATTTKQPTARLFGLEELRAATAEEEVDDEEIRLILRSPEGVLYYLGELMRVGVEAEFRTSVEVCVQERMQPLFLVLPPDRCPGEAFVDARSPWGDYAIPRSTAARAGDCRDGQLTYAASTQCDPGRSMQALRLLSQLISLQRASEELPAPALVRVVGD